MSDHVSLGLVTVGYIQSPYGLLQWFSLLISITHASSLMSHYSISD